MSSPQSPKTSTVHHNGYLTAVSHEKGHTDRSVAPAYLLLSWLPLQDEFFPDWVEHAALPAEVSEALLFIVPVHLHNTREYKFPAIF